MSLLSSRSLDDVHFDLVAVLENKKIRPQATGVPFTVTPENPVFKAFDDDGETEYRAQFLITADFPQGSKPDLTEGPVPVSSFLQWKLSAVRKAGSGQFCYSTSKVYKADAPTVVVQQSAAVPHPLPAGNRNK